VPYFCLKWGWYALFDKYRTSVPCATKIETRLRSLEYFGGTPIRVAYRPPDTMAASADKQTALVSAIAAGVYDRLQPNIMALEESNIRMQVTCNAILARMELLDTANNVVGGSATSKRPVVNSAAKKGAKASDAKNPAVKKKHTNAMLFLKDCMTKNLLNMRQAYGSDKFLARVVKAKDLDELAKKSADALGKEYDEEAYYKVVAAAVWSILTPEEKLEIKTINKALNEESDRVAAAPQLELEEEGDEEDDENV
jgi:hypothetical protein